MFDRIIGTGVASVYCVCAFLIFCGVDGHVNEQALWKRILLWLLVCASGWLWGWLRFRFPQHPLLAMTAAFTTPIIYAGGVTGMDPLNNAMMRTACTLIGIVVSALVVRYFLPKRARIDVILNLATILDELAQTLEPLVELESGLVSSPSFLLHGDEIFTAQAERTHTYKSSELRHRVQVNADTWEEFRTALWSRLERCGKLILAQSTLLMAAKGEYSVRPHHTLVIKEHDLAVTATRTLFYHVTSLFTLIDTQVTAAETEFDNEGLYQEAQQFSRFGVLSLATSDAHFESTTCDPSLADKTLSAPVLFMSTHRTTDNISIRNVPYSVADLGELDMRGAWDTKSSHREGGPRRLEAQLDPVEEYRADVAPLLRWADTYGPTVGGMVRHICTALRRTAADLRTTTRTEDAGRALREAGRLISHFHRQRAERQQAVAILVEHAMRNDADSFNWTVERDPKFAYRFDKVLGMSPEDYRELSEEGREAFWQNYWLLRDRLSTTDTTVVSLFMAVRNAVSAVELLIEERIARRERHHLHRMLVSADEARLHAEIAVQSAGGGARNIG
eukprot:Gregarina_sp_Poly_1__7278@NODE_3_length_27868_cov_154_961188_g2_i0_p8_GENE_NODE_3_length_27868_cov_154_961188_g2_i0NODE_3_length_27868_cov_154_961188_g2_i0_p8_ORF_typecomplete_len562_score72_16FUSC/PF04632_12/3_1e12FUSC/PF04632_12/6_6ALMT/PF11744_8/8e10FUSC_2/PF13515_6/0_0001SNF2_assoc/PF08455_10/0_021ArAE_2_N/PF10337_9/0_048SH3_14/PF18343_1/0_068STAT1_TAZ2bind/PF12162_8/1_1e04STAT1_TAZ2bind/PF12162_8/0_051STAT1_TAZ2bind/PF12162_8/4_6e03DUF4131/PF13567_6/1_7_NODE_3_length_27868_cov_154_961188_g2